MNQRVLIVDDEPPARERLRRLVGELGGIEVSAEASGGEQAVRLAGELRPDVVLLDVRMPGMNGLEAARQIGSRAHIVFVTAYDQHAVEAFERGAIDYVLKPFNEERLGLTVERLRERVAARPEPSLDADREEHVGRLRLAVGEPFVVRPALELDVVEVHPGADQPVRRERLQVRPGHLDAHAAAEDAQTVVPDPTLLGGGVDPHGNELFDCTRRQAVTADLLAGELRLLQRDDVHARLRQVIRGGRPAGSSADDDDVSVDVHAGHRAPAIDACLERL